MARWQMALLTILLMNGSASGFTSSRTTTPINIRSNVIMLLAQKQHHHSEEWTKKFVTSAILVSTLVIGSTTATMPAALADEYGVETEAPTLFTGESVMVCMYVYMYDMWNQWHTYIWCTVCSIIWDVYPHTHTPFLC